MKVTVLGSWREKDAVKWNLKASDLFATACRKLGETIVRQGHSLIASSDDNETADFHAVQGALAALETNPVPWAPIRLFGDRTSFGAWLPKYHEWITTDDSPAAAWEHARLFQVKLSDCVVTVGGAVGTFHTGFAAAIAGRVVVPVGSFGGASEQLRRMFRETYGEWTRLPPRELLGKLKVAWHDDLAEQIAGLIVREPRLAVIHGRSPHRNALRGFLHRKMKLPKPVIMREEFLPGATLPEKWEKLANDIDGAIALVTPDDLGGLADRSKSGSSKKKKEKEKRARENVWIEAGWIWGRLGRERLLLVRQGDTKIPSDLLGSDVAEYQKGPKEAEATIRKFVESIRERL